MKRSLIISILVLCLFLLTACNREQPTTPTKGAFLGGTQGVTADFGPFGVEEEGVYSIFDEESFPLEVTVHNKGEHTLEAGDVTVTIEGISKEEFSGINSFELKNNQRIEGVSEFLPGGGEETITFATDTEYAGDVTTVLDRKWYADVVYNYETELIIPEVCLKEDPTVRREECPVNEAKDFFTSGAPVTVTSVHEELAGKGIVALRIAIENVGGGDVAKLGEEFNTRRQELTYKIDDPDWECKSGGRVDEAHLQDGKQTIICRLKEALSEGTFEAKQVKITFQYQYRDIIKDTLRIKESLK